MTIGRFPKSKLSWPKPNVAKLRQIAKVQIQVPFVRLVLEECSKGRELNEAQRTAALAATLDMVERIRQEVRKVGFWKNNAMREQLTRALVRDLDRAGVCPAGKERDLAQRLVALARENHEYLTRP
jgi:type I restriction enzyme R subunit